MTSHEERERNDTRKLFTGLALVGLCAAHGRVDLDEQTVNSIAESAVRVADATVKALGEDAGRA